MLARLERRLTEEGSHLPSLVVRLARLLNGNREISLATAESLRQQLDRQTQRYLDLKYRDTLGLKYADYINSLPYFEPQKREHAGRVDRPVLVDPRIPWQLQCELAGIDATKLIQVSQVMAVNAPEQPYLAWMQNIRVSPQISAAEANRKMGPYERGATIYDGIAYAIMYPEDVKSEGIILPGTTLDSGYRTIALRPVDDRLVLEPIMMEASPSGLHALSVGI